MPKLLIVEDYDTLRVSLRMAFEGTGYDVRCVRNGELGYLYVLNWEPDVVITDYMMPGMNGIELIKKIVGNGRDRRESRQSISFRPGDRSLQHFNHVKCPRIILLSARMDEALVKEALIAGVDRCMAKPFELIALRITVEELMG